MGSTAGTRTTRRFGGAALVALAAALVLPAAAAADGGDGGPCLTAEFTPHEESLPANSPGIMVSQTTPVVVERLVDGAWESVDVTVVPLGGPYYRDPGLDERLLAIPDLVVGEQLRALTECGREQEYTVTPPLDAPAGLSLTVEPERRPVTDGTDRFAAVIRPQPEGVLDEHAFIWRTYIAVDGEPNVSSAPRLAYPDPTYRFPLACEGAEGWEPGTHEIAFEMGPAGAEPTAVFTGTFELRCPGGVDADTLTDDGCSAASGRRSGPWSFAAIAAAFFVGRRRREPDRAVRRRVPAKRPG